MRPVPDDEVGAGVDHASCEQNHVSPGLAVVLLFGERQVSCVHALGATVEGDDHDVVRLGELRNGRLGELVVEHHVGFLRDRVGEDGDAQLAGLETREVALAARMVDADGGERLHRRRSTLLAEVAGVVVGQAQHVESGCLEVTRIARG